MDKKRKRFPLVRFSSAALICMVVLMVTIGIIGNQRKNSLNEKHISLSKKSLLDMCRGVDYSDACRQIIPFRLFSKDNRPGVLLRAGFEAAMKDMRGAAQRAIAFKAEQSDNYTKSALQSCSKLADRAFNDLQRSLDRFDNRDQDDIGDILDDLLTWMSGSLTYQQTCIDAFLRDNGKPIGPIFEQMRMVLNRGMELTINGLGMASQLAQKNENQDDGKTDEKSNDGKPDDKSNDKNADGKQQHRRLKSWEGLESTKRTLLQATPGNIKADVIVAQDGTGKYKTINEAVKVIPLNGTKQFVIYIKAGVYNEKVTIDSAMMHVMIIGDGPTKTKITGAGSVMDGQTTFLTSTLAVEGDFFIGKDFGVENTAGGAKGQAVALRVGADKSAFLNLQVDGHQDSLYTHTYRQFYRDCTISGTVDFIFGDAAVVFQNCKFLVRRPEISQVSVVMAQSRINVRQPTGMVLQNCTIIEDPNPAERPDKAIHEAYLGRPWTEFSRTVIMESFIGDIIRPGGYALWNGTYGVDTSFYVEANNRGPGAAKNLRVKWKAIQELTDQELERYTPKAFIQADTWLADTKIPFAPGFVLPRNRNKKQIADAPAPGENADIPFQDQRPCYASHPNFTGTSCT